MNLAPHRSSLIIPSSLVFVHPKSLCAPWFLHFLMWDYLTLAAHVFARSLAFLVTGAFLVIDLRRQFTLIIHLWPLVLV